MNDLISVVDWSRAQFALTAMYHWLFVPLTLGLSVIVAIMETMYVKTNSEKWLAITKFWMKLFGINFAMGVATGLILEFEFGTNWSNYSWFVGDIFGAPLAIEGLLAFFMEATFVAVMFFGWGKVSKGFHLTATWLTAIGATLSAAWILIANAWMQLPVGMEFDAAQMRNVMDRFWDIVFSPMAVHKFTHTVLSGWTLAGVFVLSVSCWFFFVKRNKDMAIRSIKVGGWVGLIGIILTIYSGDKSALTVAKYQPMKFAAMEALYHGGTHAPILIAGQLNPEKTLTNDVDPYTWKVEMPELLSILATHKADGYVPGIADIIEGKATDDNGNEVLTASYEERIAIGKKAHDALRAYDVARTSGDSIAMNQALKQLKQNYKYFGYGYLSSVDEAVPPISLTFYAFRLMVLAGGYLLVFFAVFLFMAYKKPGFFRSRWSQWIGMLSLVVVYICSECGWITAEVGRQPWIIQDLMPTRAAISFISSSMVQVTFWLFAAIFTGLLAAEVGILIKAINKGSQVQYDSLPEGDKVTESVTK